MNSIAFIIISVFTLAGALAAATLPNLMHAALCLVLALLGLASFFFLLGAEFVGLALVFIYIGAVAVLIVFTILLTRRDSKEHYAINWSGVLIAFAVFGGLTWAILKTQSLSADLRIYIDRAQSGLTRLTAILARMTEATRLEHALKDSVRERFNAAEVVSGCVDGYRLAYPETTIALALPEGEVQLLGEPELFAQMLVTSLFSKHRILTQIAGHAMDVIKILPPLIIGEKEIALFVTALDNVLTDCRRFPGPMWELGNNFVRAAISSRRSSQAPVVSA